MERVKVEI